MAAELALCQQHSVIGGGAAAVEPCEIKKLKGLKVKKEVGEERGQIKGMTPRG